MGGEDEFILAAQDLPRQLHAYPVGLLRRNLPRLKRLDEVPAQVRTLVDGMAAGPCKFDVGGFAVQPKEDTSSFPSVLSGLQI